MNINIMTIVYVLFVILYLAFIYYRMIKREIPKPIGWVMALVPIAFGMATFDISGFTGYIWVMLQCTNLWQNYLLYLDRY